MRQEGALEVPVAVLFFRICSMFFGYVVFERFSMEEQGNQIIIESNFDQRDAFRES